MTLVILLLLLATCFLLKRSYVTNLCVVLAPTQWFMLESIRGVTVWCWIELQSNQLCCLPSDLVTCFLTSTACCATYFLIGFLAFYLMLLLMLLLDRFASKVLWQQALCRGLLDRLDDMLLLDKLVPWPSWRIKFHISNLTSCFANYLKEWAMIIAVGLMTAAAFDGLAMLLAPVHCHYVAQQMVQRYVLQYQAAWQIVWRCTL